MRLRSRWLAVLPLALGCSSSDAGPEAAALPDAGAEVAVEAAPGPLVDVTGKAFVFFSPTGTDDVTGATIAATELPSSTTTVQADGTFALRVPSGAAYSFTLTKQGFHTTQTATLLVGPSGLDRVGFQVPPDAVFAALASVVKVEADPTRCQIATTVSAAGTTPYGGDAVGEPGVTVTIDPPVPAASGPVYFAYYAGGMILPDRALTETTVDGGVLFLDVAPGDYRLTAHKAGKTFTPVDLRCRAGVLVNAAPPRGLQTL